LKEGVQAMAAKETGVTIGTKVGGMLRAARWLFVTALTLAVPVLLISTSARVVIGSDWLYRYGFERYNIPAYTGTDMAELMRVAGEIKDYFGNDAERLDVRVVRGGVERSLYNEREILHMVDVKGLMQGLAGLQLGSGLALAGLGAAALAWRRTLDPATLARGLLAGSAATVVLLAVGGMGALVSFGPLFHTFHELTFSNDLWLLDPRTDYLLMMFPSGFFQDAALAIAGLSIAGAVLLGTASGGYLWARRARVSRG
jgi:integral membrane protein (TIGR01906 family)